MSEVPTDPQGRFRLVVEFGLPKVRPDGRVLTIEDVEAIGSALLEEAGDDPAALGITATFTVTELPTPA